MSKKQAKVDGEHVLYHYLQKDLYETDVWLFQMLAARLVASLGIWFSPRLYHGFPTLLPFAVRDPTCRRSVGGIEEWGAPNKLGYFRDDNSLIKNLPSSLSISSHRTDIYDGRRIGSGFVASHVWREISGSEVNATLASRDPWTNSFVPNIVWLPRQVAKLTDREGSFTQLYLQALAWKIFRDRDVLPGLRRRVDKTWSMLSKPEAIPIQGLPEPEKLNFFEPTDKFVATRIQTLRTVVDAMAKVASGDALEGKVVSSRYKEGLSGVATEALVKLGGELSSYADVVNGVF